MADLDKADIEQRVRQAVQLLLQQDGFLLQSDVNERSITHKVAQYLQQYFNGWPEPYCYVNFIHFHDIFDKKWIVLSQSLPKKLVSSNPEFLSALKKLNRIRNRVAHPRKRLLDEDDFVFCEKMTLSFVKGIASPLGASQATTKRFGSAEAFVVSGRDLLVEFKKQRERKNRKVNEKVAELEGGLHLEANQEASLELKSERQKIRELFWSRGAQAQQL